MEGAFGEASYQWDNQSCWLDTCLQLLYVAILPAIEEFRKVIHRIGDNSMMLVVFQHLLHHTEETCDPMWLVQGRDEICDALHEYILADAFEANSLTVGFSLSCQGSLS